MKNKFFKKVKFLCNQNQNKEKDSSHTAGLQLCELPFSLFCMLTLDSAPALSGLDVRVYSTLMQSESAIHIIEMLFVQ